MYKIFKSRYVKIYTKIKTMNQIKRLITLSDFHCSTMFCSHHILNQVLRYFFCSFAHFDNNYIDNTSFDNNFYTFLLSRRFKHKPSEAHRSISFLISLMDFFLSIEEYKLFIVFLSEVITSFIIGTVRSNKSYKPSM